MSVRRENDLRELARLEKEKASLEKRIRTIRRRIAKGEVREGGAEEAIYKVLKRFGELSYSEIVELTHRNSNTIKTALRGMRNGGRVIHEGRKYSV
jgi:predicted  nucleic acid-binding Zn-ribbon protein